MGSLLECCDGWIYFVGCFIMQTLCCKENYVFNFSSVKLFVELLQSIFAGEADVLEPLRENIFIKDLLLTFILRVLLLTPQLWYMLNVQGVGVNLMRVTSWVSFASCFHFPYR